MSRTGSPWDEVTAPLLGEHAGGGRGRLRGLRGNIAKPRTAQLRRG